MFDHGYALLIGVDQNKIADLALPIVKKDVTKLKEVITHPDRCGYPEKQVRVLMGAESTRENIIKGLDWLKESLLADKDANQTAFLSGWGPWRQEISLQSSGKCPLNDSWLFSIAVMQRLWGSRMWRGTE